MEGSHLTRLMSVNTMEPDSVLPKTLSEDNDNLEPGFGKNHPSIRAKSCRQRC